jgi:diaminopimelate decarboxylase
MKLYGSMTVNAKGNLEIGGCDTVELARKFGTPLYVFDEAAMQEVCRSYKKTFTEDYPRGEVAFASKAFLTMAMCRLVDEEGLSLDVVSGGELYTALKADFPVERIYFHGNNKSAEELKMALESGVGRIVVDNLYELELLNHIAGISGKKAHILIRVTPGIVADTHSYIQTGQTDSKFGLGISDGRAMDAIDKALSMENIILTGLHCHIGSQIFDLKAYGAAAKVMMSFLKSIKEKHGVYLDELDMGGGLGIRYTLGDEPPTVEEYGQVLINAVTESAQELGLELPKLIVEPGRSIVGEAGTTLYTIGSIKEIPGVRTYVAIDGGMGDNPRVALYQARYEAAVANNAGKAPSDTLTVCGKCCESGDILIHDIKLAPVEPGDILAVFSTGAYNYSMASNYNRLPRPAAVLVRDGEAALILQRESYDDLIKNDIIPEHLKKA